MTENFHESKIMFWKEVQRIRKGTFLKSKISECKNVYILNELLQD